jgi:integrase
VPKAVRPLAVEAVERLRRHFLDAGDLWSILYVALVAYGGLRPSEPLALRTDDVREHTLLVHRTASHGIARHLKNRLPYRTVVLEPFLMEDVALATSKLGVHEGALLLPSDAGGMVDAEQRRS